MLEMNWKIFGTFLMVLTLVTSVALGQGTAPTILEGNYISNVFGQSNFIKNPNAKLNTKDVVASSATVAQSKTSPLVATTKFLVTFSAGGTVTWSTRAFDAGMKNQNCESRFTYKGFLATSKAQVFQGANKVAELALSPTGTDPRIASINFPCGDLSQATTFVLTDSAVNSGTNEIGGIYVGLATNLGQLNTVGVWQSYTPIVTPSAGSLTSTAVDFAQWRRVGENVQIRLLYRATQSTANAFSWSISVPSGIRLVTDTVGTAQSDRRTTINVTSVGANVLGSVKVIDATTFEVTAQLSGGVFSSGTAYAINLDLTQQVQGWGADPVVKPETQGDWWISGIFTGGLPLLGTTTASSGSFNEITNGSLSFNPDSGSQPVATLCSSTNAPPSVSTGSTTCAAGNESVGVTFNIPSVGAYEVCSEFSHSFNVGANGTVDDSFSLQETATNNNVALTTKSSLNSGHSYTSAIDTFTNTPLKLCETFNFTSIGQKAVRLMYAYSHVAPITQNQLIANGSQGNRNIKFTVQQITGKSNSALYVQGPVLGAQTGATIPEGYVNEFSTRSISDSSARTQTNPALATVYYPWSGTLTLPAGNWNICYKVLGRLIQNEVAAQIAFFKTWVQNQTDGTFLMTNSQLGQYTPTYNRLNYIWGNMAQCKPVAITSSKTFRVGISYENNTGTPTVTEIAFDGGTSASELYAIRLN